jgi:hypothetical protein
MMPDGSDRGALAKQVCGILQDVFSPICRYQSGTANVVCACPRESRCLAAADARAASIYLSRVPLGHVGPLSICASKLKRDDYIAVQYALVAIQRWRGELRCRHKRRISEGT